MVPMVVIPSILIISSWMTQCRTILRQSVVIHPDVRWRTGWGSTRIVLAIKHNVITHEVVFDQVVRSVDIRKDAISELAAWKHPSEAGNAANDVVVRNAVVGRCVEVHPVLVHM